MAKILLPGMFVREISGPIKGIHARTADPVSGPSPFTMDDYKTSIRQSQTRAMKTRRWRYARKGRMLVQPMTWKAECEVWTNVDAQYTTFPDPLKALWRVYGFGRHQSCYDAWMKWAVPIALRGLRTMPNPRNPVSTWVHRLDNCLPDERRDPYHRFWEYPTPAAQTHGLHYARLWRYKRYVGSGSPTGWDFRTWWWFEAIDYDRPSPKAGYYHLRPIHHVIGFARRYPYGPILPDFPAWSPLYRVGNGDPLAVTTFYPVVGGQLRWLPAARNLDGSLTIPQRPDWDRAVIVGILTPREQFVHWPRIDRSKKGDGIPPYPVQVADHHSAPDGPWLPY